MAEPLLRKTFAKLRARRRKSVKGGRSEDSEASETMAVGASGGSVQAARCVIGEAQSDGGCAADQCRNPEEPAPTYGAERDVECSSHAACTYSMAGRCGQEQDCQPPRQSCSEAIKSKRAAGEGEIWYNPIPEDEDVAQVPRRAGPSKAQWYVEMPCPKEAETGPGATRPRCVGPLTMLEPQAMRCSAETSPPKARAPSHPVQASGVAWTCSQLGSRTQEPQASDSVAAELIAHSGRAVGPGQRPEKTGVAAQRLPPDRGKSPGTVRRLSLRMRKLPELRRKLSLRGPSRSGRHDRDGGGESGLSPSQPRAASRRNVICRYHLDSSVGARGGRQQPSLSQRGYLSDGHSPEPVPKADGASSRWPQRGAPLDTSAFRPYSGSEQPRCLHYLSGLLNIRLLGLQAVKPPRAGPADIFCSIQVDSVSKARTALLSCPDPFLSLDHTFNIELECSQQLQLFVFTWDPSSCSNRVCCHGTAQLPPLFRGARSHQLAMQLEPRGVLYMKVSLVESRDVTACCTDEHREPRIFRIELKELVERERSGVSVPLLIQKCVSEIEKRGLKAVGLYRLCGSAAVKKELRDSFERDSASVDLSEEIYPDINVIAGILKDFLRELPSPLITKTLYDVVLEATATRPLKMSNGVPDASLSSVNTVALLDCLLQAEKATLTLLLDHLSLVASLQESNKMTCQNLAVCFGPVLLGQKQENPQQGSSCSFSHSKELASALDFKRHIEVLHYLLQLWPSDRIREKREALVDQCGRPGQQIPAAVPPPEEVVCRTRLGRSASSSRYRHAGDWSSCGRSYLRQKNGGEADNRGQLPFLGSNSPGSCGPTKGMDSGTQPSEGTDSVSQPSEGRDGRTSPLEGSNRGARPSERLDSGSWPLEGSHSGTLPLEALDSEKCPSKGSDCGIRHSERSDGGSRPSEGSDGGTRPLEESDGGKCPSKGSDSGSRPSERSGGGSRPSEGSDGGTSPSEGSDGGIHPLEGSHGGSQPSEWSDSGPISSTGLGGSPFRDAELDFESGLSGRTKDFDSLIADIERELAKKIIFL